MALTHLHSESGFRLNFETLVRNNSSSAFEGSHQAPEDFLMPAEPAEGSAQQAENPLPQNAQIDEDTQHEAALESGAPPPVSHPPSLHHLPPSPRQLPVRVHWEIDSVDTSTQDDAMAQDTIHRSEDFYFEDANLVLISNEDLAFGVHRGVMRRISAVFHDMFEVQMQVPKSEMYGGLPFIRLHDSTEDVQTFLQIVYDQKPIEEVKAPHKDLLAFCDKYSVDSILKRILVFLLQTFPTTIESWNRPRDEEQIKEAINVAIAAFRLNMKVLLPSCLYTIMAYCSSNSYYAQSYSLEKDIHKLPQPLLLSYFHGFSYFSTYALNFHRLTLNGRVTPPIGCNKAKCKENWSGFIENAEYLLRDPTYIRHPRPLEYLDKLSTLALTDFNYLTYCDKCREALPGIFKNAQREVWNSLPRVFKIADDWGDLQESSSEKNPPDWV